MTGNDGREKALSYAEGFMTALAAVLQDREWVDGKVGNITATTAEVKRLLRDVATHTGCDESELRNLREENSLLQAQIKELREALKPVCAPDPDAPKVKPVPLTEVFNCDCWHVQDGRTECWGVPEKSECSCGGDENKCDFYGG